MMKRLAALAAGLFLSAGLHAQTEEARTLQIEGGAVIAYTLRAYPAGARLDTQAKELAPTSALATSSLLKLHLMNGKIEDAALLSNAPRRRFEEFQKFQQTYGDEEFKRVFSEYYDPKNQLRAEIVIGAHSLLVWEQASPPNVAGQYFVNIDGRFFMDDVPNDTRTQLRWVLEAYRSGKLAR
jgi:hypothetical protein